MEMRIPTLFIEAKQFPFTSYFLGQLVLRARQFRRHFYRLQFRLIRIKVQLKQIYDIRIYHLMIYYYYYYFIK